MSLHVCMWVCVWGKRGGVGGRSGKSMRSDSHSAESGTTSYQI